MAIVVVGGGGRGSGKSALVCGVIAALPEMHWIAVKVANHAHGTAEPIWEETAPGEATDTARYLAAGARRAFLLTATGDAEMKDVLDSLWQTVGRNANLIFESNRVQQFVKGDVCLLVGRGSGTEDQKESYNLIAGQADAIVLHAADEESEQSLNEVEDQWSVFRLERFERLSPKMVGWLSARLGH